MKLKNELSAIAIVSLPFIYLAYIWNDLPEKVPMHWNLKGEIDRYGHKIELLLIPVVLPLLTYLLFLIIPKIDPKNKIGKMGNKYQHLKILFTAFTSILALFILYLSKNNALGSPNYIIILIGISYIILGNYFKTIKANYFIGIRTPWTLESETVWKETHRLAGKMWFSGGFLIVFLSLILENKLNFILFMIITGIITIIPIAFSYFKFKEITKKGTVQLDE